MCVEVEVHVCRGGGPRVWMSVAVEVHVCR